MTTATPSSTTPSAGALRAAKAIDTLDFCVMTPEEIARVIDEQTGAAELLACLKRLLKAAQGG